MHLHTFKCPLFTSCVRVLLHRAYKTELNRTQAPYPKNFFYSDNRLRHSRMNSIWKIVLWCSIIGAQLVPTLAPSVYSVVDTNETVLYDENGNLLDTVQRGDPFFGQDANYINTQPRYDNSANDGTVADLNTGLLWEQAHHAVRLTYYDAKRYCEALELGGQVGWRLPTIKELFSLADFTGCQQKAQYYLDNAYFALSPPDAIDDDGQFTSHTVQMMGQTWSSTIYAGDHWDKPNTEAAFFFNFLDGHIKQAPTHNNELFYRCVNGDEYGINDFVVNNNNGAVWDRNTGLLWQQEDDGICRDWKEALTYCENLSLAGQTNWRLPNIKELQSIVDYTREAPAIDTDFFTPLSHLGEAWYWSGTTHGDATNTAAYVCIGKCDDKNGVDTHGAGAQRTDPKYGSPVDYPNFGGAQHDDVRINNYVRCVSGGFPTLSTQTTNPESEGHKPRKPRKGIPPKRKGGKRG